MEFIVILVIQVLTYRGTIVLYFGYWGQGNYICVGLSWPKIGVEVTHRSVF